MRSHAVSVRSAALVGGSILGLVLSSAHATMIEGESGGVITTIDLSAAALISASVAIGTLDGASPPPYDLDTTVLDLTADASVGIPAVGAFHLFSQSGSGIVFADSDVDGTTAPTTVSGQATIEDLSFSAISITGAVPLIPLLEISTGSGVLALDSFVAVMGSNAGDITIDADVDLAGLTIEIIGSAFDLSAYVDANGDAAPNTVILPGVTGVAGLTITLNEQIDIGDNVTTFGRQVSAVHVNFSGVAYGTLPLITGDVYLSQAYALATIPEPSTLSVLTLAAALLVLRRRRNA